MKVLVTRSLPGQALERLGRRCDIELWDKNTSIPKTEILKRIVDKDGLLCLLTDIIDDQIFDAATRLRIISNYAVGYNNIDMEAAKRQGIVVSNTPGVLTNATADLTWAIILGLARRIVEADIFVRNNKWQGWDPNLMLGSDVFGKTLGIVGAGRIGKAVASRAAGFSMKTVYTSRSINENMEKELGAIRMDMDDLLRISDFVTLHIPLTPDTKHMIGEYEFSLMKKTAFLINTSRGAVVDEFALTKALEKGKIAGAGLDVFEHEPAISSRLLSLSNVVLLPHIGSATYSTRTKMADIAVDNLLAFFDKGRPLYIVK